ncbi:MAG TPA: MFS transporter, partial [Chitinophagales bacterium]|nr:MFS transporter [Chitinophagales bacterium]
MLYIIYLFKDLSRPLWLLTLVNLINRCGAMIMCFLSLYITESLHYSLTEAGLAMSIYGIGAIIGQQIGGRLTDKIGYYKVQLLSLILTGCMILVLMEVRNFYVLCVVLFFLNLVSEAFRPANSAAITDYSVTENRTRSFALMRISFNLAITFALTIGGFLIKLSWSYIFWADAITCFMAAALLMFLMNPNSNMYIHRSPIEKQTVANSHFEPYKNPLFRNFVLATFINALVFMQLVWTLPQFFKQVYHWDESTIGIIAAINGFVVMLTEMPIVHG